MSEFSAQTVEFSGELAVDTPIDEAFELFSPLGEKLWVPGWNPELLHPAGVTWERGLIFRTAEESGAAIWIVTALDRQLREVEYHRVEPARYVARIRVQCEAVGQRTRVRTSYRFIGLSPDGNTVIGRMTAAEYADKMRRWERWIESKHLRPQATAEGNRDSR